MNELTIRTTVRGAIWRVIVFLTTLILTFMLTGNVKSGVGVAMLEFGFKLFLYIKFEKFFYKNVKYGIVNGKPSIKRSLAKGLCWRTFATIVSSCLVLIVSGDAHSAGTFAMIAFPFKLSMYIAYEQYWKNIKWGLGNELQVVQA